MFRTVADFDDDVRAVFAHSLELPDLNDPSTPLPQTPCTTMSKAESHTVASDDPTTAALRSDTMFPGQDSSTGPIRRKKVKVNLRLSQQRYPGCTSRTQQQSHTLLVPLSPLQFLPPRSHSLPKPPVSPSRIVLAPKAATLLGVSFIHPRPTTSGTSASSRGSTSASAGATCSTPTTSQIFMPFKRRACRRYLQFDSSDHSSTVTQTSSLWTSRIPSGESSITDSPFASSASRSHRGSDFESQLIKSNLPAIPGDQAAENVRHARRTRRKSPPRALWTTPRGIVDSPVSSNKLGALGSPVPSSRASSRGSDANASVPAFTNRAHCSSHDAAPAYSFLDLVAQESKQVGQSQCLSQNACPGHAPEGTRIASMRASISLWR